MQNGKQSTHIKLQHKLTIIHAVVTLIAILIAEGLTLGLSALRGETLPLGLHLTLVILVAIVSGLLLGRWVCHRLAQRVNRALEISQAWLRGNLALRISDPIADNLGQLTAQLDQIAEHLEEDEEDLEALRTHNTRLTDQVRALAVVEERNRLARELHDSVKQHLFSLAMTASAIRTRFDMQEGMPEDMVEMAREIEKSAQTAQRETTRLIEDLRPGSLEQQGLAEALNDYTLLFGAQEHILIYLDVTGNDKVLPPPVTEALYRVAQEALHNVARHAQATRVDVALHAFTEKATLVIEDNGVGFDPMERRQGLGVANMQERLMSVGGRLTIESEIGVGTTVIAEVGLTHALRTPGSLALRGAYAPVPTVENWQWLGQRLVIPVGQTWPWLPADQRHLRSLFQDYREDALIIRRSGGLLGLTRSYTIKPVQQLTPIVKITPHANQTRYEWRSEGSSWELRHIRGLRGRMVLYRHDQPLAAMQYRGRQLSTWTEIIYDDRGYRLSYVKDRPEDYVLVDEAGETLLTVTHKETTQMSLDRPIPMQLLVMIAIRIIDEGAVTNTRLHQRSDNTAPSQT